MKIALVSSVGGHLTELLAVSEQLTARGHTAFWVVNDESPVLPAGVDAYRILHGERDLRVAWNVLELAAIFARERPELVLSAGASPAVSAALVARLAGIPVVYVEPSSSVTRLTVTGRLMRCFADRFFVQWEGLLQQAPWARYAGGLL
ncbi:MAG: glycosyltransferase [Myxococcales bacterium]|nr:glycosyltransferase [Myxococcales bacterium]MDD9969528.1 glycosyltransferase [Myxococcales bacterium]